MSLTNIIITGNSRTGKSTYAQSLVQPHQYFNIKTGGFPIYEILANLKTVLVDANRDTKNRTLIVDDLNYGAYSTRDLVRIIKEIYNVVNKINNRRTTPLIDTIIWIGTRKTLIKLVIDDLTNQLMNDSEPAQSIRLESVNKINSEPLQDYFVDETNPFDVYTIYVKTKIEWF